MYDSESLRFADFEADAERNRRSARRIHQLERRIAQLEAQVESLLSVISQQSVSPWQLGLDLDASGAVAGQHQGGAR